MTEPVRASGKLVVVLTPAANLNVSPLITDTIAGAPTSFGIAGLDALLALSPVLSVTRLHKTVEADVSIDPALVADLRATYLVRLADTVDLDTVIASMSLLVGIIARVEPVFVVEPYAVPNDPIFNNAELPKNQWGLATIRAALAWDRQLGAPLVNVAVIDSGCDKNHPDLAARLLPGWDFAEDPRPVPPWQRAGDFTSPDPDPQDELGHGTMVAGIIGALTNNSIGMAGVTWKGLIAPARVIVRTVKPGTTEVSGVANTEETAKAIVWAAGLSQVINMSFGSPADVAHQRQAIQYALARNCVAVAATGNDNASIPCFPAAYPGVIAVGAMSITNARWLINASIGSNFGDHVSVTAPGDGIWSTNLFATFGSPGYSVASGTSLAAPHVTGVAALMKACNMSLKSAQIKTIIEQTANRVIPWPPGQTFPNVFFGHGILDAKAAVDRTLDGPIPP